MGYDCDHNHTHGEKVASQSKTFGYKRLEILGTVLNGVTLIAITLIVFFMKQSNAVRVP